MGILAPVSSTPNNSTIFNQMKTEIPIVNNNDCHIFEPMQALIFHLRPKYASMIHNVQLSMSHATAHESF